MGVTLATHIDVDTMRKIFYSCLLLISFVLPAAAQLREGYIRFDVKFDNNEFSDQEKAMLPAMSEMWFRRSEMMMRMPTAMGMETKVLIKESEMYILMDILGNRMAIKSSREEMKNNTKAGKNYKLKSIVDEKKMIAGYECKKAIMTIDSGEEMVLWYTDKLAVDGAWYYQMDGITGCPMEFSASSNGLTFKMVAVEVKGDKPEDDLFRVPGDYKVMTQAELQKMFGGLK